MEHLIDYIYINKLFKKNNKSKVLLIILLSLLLIKLLHLNIIIGKLIIINKILFIL